MSYLLLEDGTSHLLLESSGSLLLDEAVVVLTAAPVLTQAPRLVVLPAAAGAGVAVTQATRVVVVDVRAPANLTQAPRIVVLKPKVPLSILIDGIEHRTEARYTSLTINYQLGARGTAKVEIRDYDSFETAFRPTLDQRLEVFGTDGEPLFRGTIFGVTDTPLGAPGVGTVTAIDAVDDWVGAALRRVTKTYAAGTTLHDVVADLTTTYLAVYGITLDPLMGAGPALPDVTFDNVTLEEAFNQLVDLSSGWVYRLTPYQIIQWFPIGAHAWPFTLSAENQNIIGPITWTKSHSQSTNRIVLRYGTGLVGKQQLWYGDGVTLRFTPDYPPTFPAPASNGWIGWMNYVGGPFPGPPVPTVPPSYGGHEAIGVSAANNFPWWWDATTGELVRNIGAPIPHWSGGTTAQVPLVGDYFWIDYNVQFPLTVTAESPAALTFPIESVVDRADIFDKAQAQAYANSLLAKFASTPRTVTLKTRAAEDFLPGDTVPMDVPSRTLPSSEWLVTEVSIIVEVDQEFMITLSLLEGTTAQASWIDFWRDIAGGGASVGVASGSITPPPAGGGGGGGSGTVANVMPLTLHALVVGEGDINVGALGDLGTTAKVLHGNPTGDPTFRPVDVLDLGGPIADGKVPVADASAPTGFSWQTPVTGGGGGARIFTAPYATPPTAPAAGDLWFPTDSLYVLRYSGTAWVPWGPVFPCTDPVLAALTTWVNQGPATASTTTGGIFLLGPATGGVNLRCLVKAAPATPYTITAALLPHLMAVDFMGAGILFRDSASGKMTSIGLVHNANWALDINKWTDAVTFNGQYLSAPVQSQFNVVFLRIADNGTNRICSFSNDGIHWRVIHTIARTDFLTANQVGFFVNCQETTWDAGLTLLSWTEG